MSQSIEGSVIQEAPVFHPSAEEWANPIEYIQAIRPRAEYAGICKIVPPKSFTPPLAFDRETFKFRTRVQSLCKLEAIARVEREFMHDLRVKLFKRGSPMGIEPLPMVPSQLKGHVMPLRLYQLYRALAVFGGGMKVVSEGLWPKVVAFMFGEEFKYDEEVTRKLELAYDQYLSFLDDSRLEEDSELDFYASKEEIFKLALRGVKQGRKGSIRAQVSTSAGSAALAQSKLHAASVKKRRLAAQPSSLSDEVALEVPKVRKGLTFWKYFPDMEKSLQGTVTERLTGATDDDDGALWNVQFLPGRENSFVEEVDGDSLVMLIASGESKDCAKYAFLDGICQVCFRASRPERLLICDGCNFAYHTFCLKPKLTAVPPGDWFCPVCLEDYEEGVDTDVDGDEEIVEPRGNNEDGSRAMGEAEKRKRKQLSSFGFGEGGLYTIPEYEAHADNFKIDYFNKVKAANPEHNTDLFLQSTEGGVERRRAAYALEQEYWRLVSVNARASEDSELLDLTVLYGSDLDTGQLGSGFPTKRSIRELESKIAAAQKELDQTPGRGRGKLQKGLEQLRRSLAEHIKYSKSGWNLNNLPTHKGSLLQYVDANITGVMVPWLYLGMCFSSFCWHTEDHYFASINYHHFGAAKTWYGVPGSSAEKFEAAAKDLAPELFDARPDLLTGIVTQFNPLELAAKDVPVYHTVQYEGDFVLTFPRGYHGGFNHGLNCAEAVNFATPSWLPFGDDCLRRYVELKKTPVISHEALLCSLYLVAMETNDKMNAIAAHLYPSLHRMVQSELQARKALECRKLPVLTSHPERTAIAPLNTEHGETEELTTKQLASPHGMKRKTPGQMTAGPQEPAFNSGRERGSELKDSVSSTMSRMGGKNMSKMYRSMVQCHVCRRYCSLSYLWNKGTNRGYCLEHGVSMPADPHTVLVHLFPEHVLLQMVNNLSKHVKETKSSTNM